LGGRKDSHAIKNPVSLIAGGSVLEHMEEDPRGDRLTQVHLAKSAIKWE